MEVTNTIGRRKTAVARIYLKPGTGNITVNKRPLDQYFKTEVLRIIVNLSLIHISEPTRPY